MGSFFVFWGFHFKLEIKKRWEGDFKGTFYEQELQLSRTTEYNIEKILRYKTVKGKRFARVQWRGYDSSYNSWEPVEAIRKL